MRVRSGFVSNSSSCSFILVLSEDKYEKLIAEEHEAIRKVAETLGKQKTFEGQPVRVISWFEGNGHSLDDMDINYDNYDGNIHSDWGIFTRMAGEHGLLAGIEN